LASTTITYIAIAETQDGKGVSQLKHIADK
jgi:hypothetical protein